MYSPDTFVRRFFIARIKGSVVRKLICSSYKKYYISINDIYFHVLVLLFCGENTRFTISEILFGLFIKRGMVSLNIPIGVFVL